MLLPACSKRSKMSTILRTATNLSSTYLSSPESILASATTVKCRTVKEIPKFGHWDITWFTEDLPAESTLELPLWLVIALSKRKIVQATLPSEYLATVSSQGVDDPHVNLREVSPSFYELGLLYGKMLGHEDECELVEELILVFKERIIAMGQFDSKVLPRVGATSEAIQQSKSPIQYSHMDNFERRLYEDSVTSVSNLKVWLDSFTLSGSPTSDFPVEQREPGHPQVRESYQSETASLNQPEKPPVREPFQVEATDPAVAYPSVFSGTVLESGEGSLGAVSSLQPQAQVPCQSNASATEVHSTVSGTLVASDDTCFGTLSSVNYPMEFQDFPIFE